MGRKRLPLFPKGFGALPRGVQGLRARVAVRAVPYRSTEPSTASPDRPLPRDRRNDPIPDVEVPHTQLGTGRRGTYPAAREWGYDKSGKLVPKREIHWTDHSRPQQHTDPHQHTFTPNPTGGTLQRGKPQPWIFHNETVEVDAFRPDGSARGLIEFLRPLDGNDFQWSILEFDGVANPLSDMSVGDFGDLAHSLPKGYQITWPDLLIFSAQIAQTYDCLIVAFTDLSKVNRPDIENGDYENLSFLVELLDTSFWTVWAPDEYVIE